MILLTSLVAQMVKASAYSAGDPGSILGSERSPGEGNGNPLQYSCLENPLDRGAWEATVHGITESERLSYFTCTFSDFTASAYQYYPALPPRMMKSSQAAGQQVTQLLNTILRACYLAHS